MSGVDQCPEPCDPDCEVGPEHCINVHLPRHEWTHPPEACETLRKLNRDLERLQMIRATAREHGVL